MKHRDYQLLIFAGIVLLYLFGQAVIGTYDPSEDRFYFDAPADVDFLYYGAITTTVLDNFPPQNPAFAGVKLTQPYMQFYPVAILAKLINPYNAMRLLNIVYLVLFGFLLKKYFPGRYGIALIMLFAASTFGVTINAAGVDFIARGFTHVPFFILLTMALYDDDLKRRILSLAVAALINGYVMLMILPFLGIVVLVERKREWLVLLATGVIATGLSTLFIASEMMTRPWHFILTESFRFNPLDIIKHAAPFLVLSAFYHEWKMLILLATAGLFGMFIHYNPFFPVFLIYFAGAMLIANGQARFPKSEFLAGAFAVILLVGFVIAESQKYNPEAGNYIPRHDERLLGAVAWLTEHTDRATVVAALTADEHDLALVMDKRPVYLGYIGHLGHLGLDWQPRYDNTMKLFTSGIAPSGVDFVFYGPVERTYFPNAVLSFDTAYTDGSVTLYRVVQKP